MYPPFRYNGQRYSRLARNMLENKAEVRQQLPLYSGPVASDVGTYRAFRPRYLCYLTDDWFDMSTDDWFERRPVKLNDYTPYIFVSYSKTQFLVNHGQDEARDEENMNRLKAFVLQALLEMRGSDSAAKPRAFWIDTLCQPFQAYNEQTGQEYEVNEAKEKERLTDYDVYTMSDIIRGAEHTVILSQMSLPAEDQEFDSVWEERYAGPALRLWGCRVWTLPEVLLSRGDKVTVQFVIGNQLKSWKDVDKIRLAELAWEDANVSRQLVEHFRTLPLSRLEFVRFAVQCIHNRDLEWFLPGDRSYALMGLLRLRPPIDSTDSSFTAFARLSLTQDSDRLMERLICLFPRNRQEPWERMSDQYNASLWDIYPSTQVCGVGENDTIIVDGFQGAMIQWSKFHTLATFNRMTLGRTILLLIVSFLPFMFLLLALAEAFAQAVGVAVVVFILWLIMSMLLPLCYPRLYNGKLHYVEPCLFGVEGYVPLEELEEKLFGLRLNRLQWSTNGSPLSRHRVLHGYEAGCEELRSNDIVDRGFSSRAELGKLIHTYPVEGIDPLSKCDKCEWGNPLACDAHPTSTSVHAMGNSRFGDMKLFTLIDTVSMTATLFEAAGPPVALLVGGSEGGMQRALACSYDITTGIMHREAVLRLPSVSLDTLSAMPRVRLGLASSFKLRNQHDPPPPLQEFTTTVAVIGNDKFLDVPLLNYPVPP
ncbi:hypothetical protein F4818DRAFT_424588 [Hypoxylon cercidicola]|nr:hypothetical protein F4818DRAFT_424588 [Hypoxylon cercidicola]